MIVLASSSPRRRELLQQVGIDFEVHSFEIDESPHLHEAPADYVVRLAIQKAQAAIAQLAPDTIVIAADTTVTIDGQILGKPASQADAFAMWHRLSGRDHFVMTGVAVAKNQTVLHRRVTTEVHFTHLTAADMQAYWQSGEPLGKAGGYAIQGLGAAFIPKIHGSYSNVVGLPLFETLDLLKEIQ
ncbi:Maf family protein [Alkanindiges sp. WGS2144]|uniref:Maf family protein n=1 Tax=Alkanindiges sp. WGS2144 TaxID=3366808 RepID=UPI0037525FE6